MVHYVFQVSVFESLHHYHGSTYLYTHLIPIVDKKQDHFGPQQQGPNNAAKSQVCLDVLVFGVSAPFSWYFLGISQWGGLKVESSESKVTYFQMIILAMISSHEIAFKKISLRNLLLSSGDLHLGEMTWNDHNFAAAAFWRGPLTTQALLGSVAV